MGTNFYWKLPVPAAVTSVALPTGETYEPPRYPRHTDDPCVHIGKRSAAGLYCWDCDETLCSGGKNRIHYGDPMLDACWKCGAKAVTGGSLARGPVAVELGFAKPEIERPRGVEGTSSFSWAQDPVAVRRACEAHMSEAIIVDEYDRESTGAEFLGAHLRRVPRHKGYLVTLDHDVREDDAEAILNALRMVKGVLHVEPVLAKGMDDSIAEARVRRDIQQRLYEALKTK